MKRLMGIMLVLALLGGAALAEDGGTRITVFEGLVIEVPEAPEIEVPDVPKPTATAKPKLKAPEIPELDLPGADPEAPDGGDGAVDAADEGRREAEAEAGAPDSAPPGWAMDIVVDIPLDGAVDSAEEDPVEAALDALGVEAYRRTYRALAAGEVVKRGSKGETARGVQQTLIALGQPLEADGNVGPKTIAALNAAQDACGLARTETLDAEGYGALLAALAAAR